MNSDTALESLRAIQQEFSEFCAAHGRVSESDTRAKLIDRILKEVLAWPEEFISREDRSDRGFIDYVASLPGRRTLVVEAKREGIAFTIPLNLEHKTYKLDGSLVTDKDVKSAIDQAREYCSEEGIRYGLVTNGYAWIVFRAIREDVPWRKGYARVFPSLEYIAAHFTEFWNLLSYPAVTLGKLEEEFGSTISASRELHRVVERLFNADLPLQRNRLHAQLEPVIRTFFSDIADQEALEILQSCYVHSASLRIVAADLGCVITDAIPRFLQDEGTQPIQQTASDGGGFDRVISQALRMPRGELFLILGGIGSGKTTFLKRYQRTVGRDLLDSKSIWFYVDFLKAPLDPTILEDFVWQDILGQLRTRYTTPHLETRRNIKRVFSDDINALRETALRNMTPGSNEFEQALNPFLARWQQNLSLYVPRLLTLCKPRRDLTVVLFVDNVDQLPPAYQAQVFLLAQRVTRLVECVTVVSLREESYFAAEIQRTFTAYNNKKFHIASPRFRVLIGSRIEFALDVLQRSEHDVEVLLPTGIALDRDAIADFLRIVKESIFHSNRDIARFIESICFGNMRLALQMFATFLTSGATDVDKMLHIYRRDGAYYVAFHEFVKAIVLGERRYYKEEQSPILNVFDCGAQRAASHFTTLRALELLGRHRGESTPQGQGYVSVINLVSQFEDVFDSREDVVRTLNRLVSRQLIEVNTRSTESIEGASHCRITSAGWYYARFLVGSFPYLDLVLQDTPLADLNVEGRLRRAVTEVDNLSDREDQKAERMEVRFARVETYLQYLQAEEDREWSTFSLAGRAGFNTLRFVPDVKVAYERQRDWIRRRLKENRERYSDELLWGDAAEATEIDADLEASEDVPDGDEQPSQ